MIRLLLAAFLLVAASATAEAAVTLLPPGKLCLYDDNGDPLTGGSVGFYVPDTLTPKSTWRDPSQTSLNTDPVILDSAGCAVVYGSGVYRQIVKDQLGNPIWDQLTADTSGTGSGGGQVGVAVDKFSVPGGRLTLQTGIPVMTTGLTNAFIVFYTVYNGHTIDILAGGNILNQYTFTELSLTLDSNAAHVNYHQSGLNFDVFVAVDPNVSPLTLRLCTGAGWTTSARPVGAPVARSGYGNLVNLSLINCRYGNAANDFIVVPAGLGTYVGTLYMINNGLTAYTPSQAPASGGSQPVLGVFNAYNKVLVAVRNVDNGASYNYAVADYRLARASASNTITYVNGDGENGVTAAYAQSVETGINLGDSASFCIGLDNLVCANGTAHNVDTQIGAAHGGRSEITVLLSGVLGTHIINALEASPTATPTLFNILQQATLSALFFM